MNEQQFAHHLHTIAERDVPHKDIWPAIQQRVQPRQASKASRRMLPTTRMGWAAMAMMVLLPLGALGHKAYTTVQDLYQADAGLQSILDRGLGEEINQSQTVDGFTFNLQQVYADANRIVIGYTVSGDALREYNHKEDKPLFPHFKLSDATGMEIPSGGGGFTYPKDGTVSVIDQFDTSEIDQVGGIVRAEVELREWQPTIDPVTTRNNRTIAGPVTFDFTITPHEDVRVVRVNQTVVSEGTAITVQQLRISPTAAYATVCVDAPTDASSRYWQSNGTLRTGASMVDRIEGEAGPHSAASANCYTLKFLAPHYYERGGEWTLTLTELRVSDQTWTITQQVAGEWTWTFDVPQP